MPEHLSKMIFFHIKDRGACKGDTFLTCVLFQWNLILVMFYCVLNDIFADPFLFGSLCMILFFEWLVLWTDGVLGKFQLRTQGKLREIN
jgi:hypothetical protein